ncbi:putative dna repair protein [Venturia nashicola]|uniref:Putative dna repair protein n=1 Tax=Venturia nashicola TaxID=86259 RepID=A0A4Z1P168_9PEZI|nr:putative dna repair protein [Venturia nashicola]
MPRTRKLDYPSVKRSIFVPRQSCLHRQAAIALYRALLTQCRAAPFNQEDKVSLQHIVRNRFHANRDKISSRLLKLHFQAGYKALDHLDGAVANDAPSVTTIEAYLSQTPQHLKNPRPPPPPREVPQDHYPPPPEHKFLANFPRPHVEGIRKVPFLIACLTPFLRYKKPQPYSLSRIIRQTIFQRQNRLDAQDMIHDYHQPLAQYEDAWDRIIWKDFGVRDDDRETFSRPIEKIGEELSIRLKEQEKRSVAVAKVKWDILQQEKALAIKERDERRRIAWEKRQERYRLEGRVPIEKKATPTQRD